MKTNLSLPTIISRICVALLTLLGYSCNNSEPDMYGTPVSTWEIKGEVTDEDNEPVSDATVKVTYPNMDSSEYSAGVAKTDKEGSYFSTGEGGGSLYLKVVCIPSNPKLKADSTVVKLKYSGGNKDDFWNFGHAAETVDFKLKKKEP